MSRVAPEPPARVRGMLPYLEHLVPLAGCAVLIASCILVSARKFFWNDELYSHYLLAEPSLAGMLAAFHAPINNTPPLYFVMGWLWARPFGAGELSLRLFSSLAFCVALWLTWRVLRRAYGPTPAAIGSLAVFCTSVLVFEQNAEARMYGLYLALAAAALLLFDRSMRERDPSRRTVMALVAVHAALVLTHLLAPLYSAAFAVAVILADAGLRRFRPRAWLPIAGAWLAFVLYVPSFLVQVRAGDPRSWVPVPLLTDMLEFLTLSSGALLLPSAVILTVFAGGMYALAGRSSESAGTTAPVAPPRSDMHLLVLAFVLLLLPAVIWAVSRIVRPIWFDRYMIPSALGWAILLARVSATAMATPARVLPRTALAARGAVTAVVLILFLAQPILLALRVEPGLRPGTGDDRFGYADLPIVTQASHQFLERQRYAERPGRYVFILDRDAAFAEASGAFGAQEYRHLVALREHFGDIFEGRILESDEFLARHERFLVLDHPEFDRTCEPRMIGVHDWDDIHCPLWVERRLLADPAWDVAVLGDTPAGTVLLVQRAPHAEPFAAHPDSLPPAAAAHTPSGS